VVQEVMTFMTDLYETTAKQISVATMPISKTGNDVMFQQHTQLHENMAFVLILFDLCRYQIQELENNNADNTTEIVFQITQNMSEYKTLYQSLQLLRMELEVWNEQCSGPTDCLKLWPKSIKARFVKKLEKALGAMKIFPVSSIQEILTCMRLKSPNEKAVALLAIPRFFPAVEMALFWLEKRLESIFFELEAFNSFDQRFFHDFPFQEGDPELGRLLQLFEKLDWIDEYGNSIISSFYPFSVMAFESEVHALSMWESFLNDKEKVEKSFEEVAFAWQELMNNKRMEVIVKKSQAKIGNEGKRGFKHDDHASLLYL
jgi:hypothetical protein